MIKVYNHSSALQTIAKTSGKWCMFVSLPSDMHLKETLKAIPFIKNECENWLQIIADGQAILEFDSEQECRNHFKQIVGDDGPTELNSYNGPARVYAMTCDPNGLLKGENT